MAKSKLELRLNSRFAIRLLLFLGIRAKHRVMFVHPFCHL
jgi:hypothetical protein